MKAQRVVLFSILVVACLSASVRGSEPPSISFSGEVAKPRTFILSDLEALKPIEVDADDHGVKARFRGVALSVLLENVGAPLGKQLRGDKLALYVRVNAKDGYRAVFALPELDPEFSDRVVIVAYQRDGKMLSDTEGPFRIVVPTDKLAARWVRQVTSVEVLESSR